jgi:hypothetical protein
MHTPPMIQPPKRHGRPVFWIVAAIGIVVAALLVIGFFLHDFYVGTASVAPGTEIRPMGLTAVLGLSWTISILLGGGFAISGFVVSLKQRRWWLAIVALMTIGVTWIPLFVSDHGFDYVVSVRQLVLSD